MSTLKQILEAALELPSEEQDMLIAALAEHKRAQLARYAQQAALEVRAGKLKPQSVADIMKQLDEPEDEVHG
ncbi:MAG: hypothetical protein ABI417_05495 [Coleofasciculaceae cyanobacterium]